MAARHQQDSALFKVVTTYNAAATHFDAEPLAFWERHGQKAVQLLELRPGARILDVGCGTGASAIPAAAAVGDQGNVIGIDVSEEMLKRARAKAAAQGRRNITFLNRDMLKSELPPAHFDAVISVFSIFFVEDMHRLLNELWQKVRPGGKLAVTTWGPDAFQPCAKIFAEEISQACPQTMNLQRPWERLCNKEKLRQLFASIGVSEPHIESDADQQPLRSPDDWWTIALGSGYRWDIDQLSGSERARVRDTILKRISNAGIASIETSALHAIAQKSND